jgi:hypothetical protein
VENQPLHTDSITPKNARLANELQVGDSWHLIVSATLSVVVVVAVAGWKFHQITAQKAIDLFAVAQAEPAPQGTDPARELAQALGMGLAPGATSSTPEEIARIGDSTIARLTSYYTYLEESGSYTPEIAAQIAASIAPSVSAHVPYTTHDPKTIPTDSGTSYKRMIEYRNDLQVSLAPLKKNSAYELDLYNTYMQTRDTRYLTELKTAAQHYRDAAAQTAKVTVPADAVSIQVGILNAMQEFAATLTFIVDNIQDPVTSLALLSSYNKAENDMTESFATLDAYYASKRP